MSSMLLLRPVPDGTFEYASVDEMPSAAEQLSTLSWSPIQAFSELESDNLKQYEAGLLILPDSIIHTRKYLPINLLTRGGFKWIRTLRKSIADLPFSWSSERYIGKSQSPLPIPFTVNPLAPRLPAIGFVLLLLIGGLFVRSLTGSELDRLENISSQLLTQLDAYQEQISVQDNQIESMRADHTISAQIQAMRGWASWLAAITLRQGALVGTIDSYTCSWTPALETSSPRPPTSIAWQLDIRNITGTGLSRLINNLEQLKLGPVEVQMDETTGALSDNPASRPITITGSYAISGVGGGQ